VYRFWSRARFFTAFDALLGVASGIYAPILDCSAERYGRIGIAFTLQSGRLVFASMLVTGAAACAAVIEACARERA
jgi:hypothetical protein